MFNILNDLIKPKNHSIYNNMDDNEKINLANKFINFFTQKIDDIYSSISIEKKNYHETAIKYESNFTFSLLSKDDVFNIIKNLKTTTCYNDPIPTQILKDKNVIKVLLPLITNIVNNSLSSGYFPDSEKCAIITPVPKTKTIDFNNLSQFRPISNLTFISKIIEKSVSIQLMNYLLQNSLISKFQSAYRPYHSVETALLKIKTDIIGEITKPNNCVLMILLDLSAAFDTVNHSILLDDLYQLGINDISLKWFKSYITDRKQCVKIENTVSTAISLKNGVPQGSILGPILFIIYIRSIDELFKKYNVKYHLYADDTQIYVSFEINQYEETIKKLESLLLETKSWMSSRYLKLNENKTEIILFGSSKNLDIIKNNYKTSMIINKTEIKFRKIVKNIGGTLDENLRMNEHINKIVKSCNLYLSQIRSIRSFLTFESVKMVTHSIIVSRIDFLNSLMINLPSYQIHKLQRVQNRAVRLIFKLPQHVPITGYLQSLHWLPVKARLEYKSIMITHKLILFNEPAYLKDMISFKEKNTIDLRSNHLHLMLEKPSCSKRSDELFDVYTPKIYNQLPISIRNCSSIITFKNNLKTFLYNKYYEL